MPKRLKKTLTERQQRVYKYYHTKVDVEDFPSECISIDSDTSKRLKQLIKLFNESKDKDYKLELAHQMNVDGLFPVCRYCGELVVNRNTRVHIWSNNTIQLTIPSIRYRVIDGKKYEISCCEKCLIERCGNHVLPISPKYYYIKNFFGKLSFGYSEEEYRKMASMTYGITEEKMKNKWGEEEGAKRWKEYCRKQSESNTFEYKQLKHGWTEEQFEEFNKSRAVTLENMIRRHGDKGKELFEQYCERQSWTNSKEYFITEYGEEAGIEKFNAFSESRLDPFKDKNYSNLSQDVFNLLLERLQSLNIDTSGIKYATRDEEQSIMTPKGNHYFLDYFDSVNKIIIEFQGDFWHANPAIYGPDDIVMYGVPAKSYWLADANKEKAIYEAYPGYTFLTIWEKDWYENKDAELDRIITEYKNKIEQSA